MKETFTSFAFLLLSSFLFFECRKELSCENCRVNNLPLIIQNKPPVANAGVDKLITLPTDSIVLDGNGSTDPDNNITSYSWTKISGPSSYNITNSNAMRATIKSLVQGNYKFGLKVIDAGGLFSTDTVNIVVTHAPVETIFDSLTWNFWHDPNDPNGLFDEVALVLFDSSNLLASSPLSIFVKLQSTTTWTPVNPVINGNCTPPYTYQIVPAGSNSWALTIDDCSLNLNLVGTRASVKIIH